MTTVRWEFGEIYSGFVAGDFPIFNITNIWGLADSPEQYLEMVAAVKEDLYRIVTRESGGQVVFRNFYPSQYFYSKRSLQTIEDFEGMKTRVHSPVLGDLISALGADDQTMAFAEVYTALERGILEAGVTAASAGIRAEVVRGYGLPDGAVYRVVRADVHHHQRGYVG